MSSINQYPTFHYSQPADYHFSHDSVFMARRIFDEIGERLGGSSILDLCAGCGVIGMDLLFHLRKDSKALPEKVDFLEIQEIYREHFLENTLRLGAQEIQLNFLAQNYELLQKTEFRQAYDLILSNPPYFLPGQGSLSPSEFKNRCRFFLDSDYQSLLIGIAHALRPQGRAYLLLRDLRAHKWDMLEETEKLIQGRLRLERLADVRGTYLVCLRPTP